MRHKPKRACEIFALRCIEAKVRPRMLLQLRITKQFSSWNHWPPDAGRRLIVSNQRSRLLAQKRVICAAR